MQKPHKKPVWDNESVFLSQAGLHCVTSCSNCHSNECNNTMKITLDNDLDSDFELDGKDKSIIPEEIAIKDRVLTKWITIG